MFSSQSGSTTVDNVTIRSARTVTEPHRPRFRDCETACKHAVLQEMREREEGLKILRVSGSLEDTATDLP